ncbi:choice-of-anchor A family protein [Novosphingobium sp. 9]|uniref:choice-of-anchor A family protein n=1 Tax=Novosphingobium sp. 9 TaxID=2025349 RepID=UPI0021B684D3|nr:choice-of-anchor A family protein [Novosphingobium sp. 9]
MSFLKSATARRMATFSATCALAAGLMSAPLFADTSASLISGTDILRTWNLVVLGDLNSTSEVEGKTFVGGNLTGSSSNYQIASSVANDSTTPGLTVVGDVTGSTKNLNNGSGAVIGGNVTSGFNLNGAAQTVEVGGTISNTNVNQNTVNSGLATSNPDFVQNLQQQSSLIQTSMTDLSHQLGTLATNSTFAISGNTGTFTAQPDASGVAVFNITTADLDKIGEISFNLNGADTAIVNVSGSSITLNDNFLGGTQNLGEHVIWNFEDATSLTATTAWGGSVLAPDAAATTYNYIQGSAVFASLNQYGEMHVGTYAGTYETPSGDSTPTDPGSTSSSSGGATAVPEPGMLALMGLGFSAVALRFRRRPRKMA